MVVVLAREEHEDAFAEVVVDNVHRRGTRYEQGLNYLQCLEKNVGKASKR